MKNFLLAFAAMGAIILAIFGGAKMFYPENCGQCCKVKKEATANEKVASLSESAKQTTDKTETHH